MNGDRSVASGYPAEAEEDGRRPLPNLEASVDHVYVHAPFCARRCVYCDFAVHVDPDPVQQAWDDVVSAELLQWRDGGVRTSRTLQTVYVGGGTPSLLPRGALSAFAEATGLTEAAGPATEWTVEANPESFTEEVAEEWIGTGVNRISLGAQTFSPAGLRWMGRLHTPGHVAAALQRARSVGIRNLSVDLILGLPDSVERSWQGDLDRVLDLDVPHISVYGLTVESGTPLARQIREGRTEAPSDDRYRREFLHAAERLSAEGYRQYEISNFARPGFESRHNQAYWNRREYLGLGNGAHSFVGGVRWWNHRPWDQYRAAVGGGGSPVAGWERPSPAQVRLEQLWLGLRTDRGLGADVFAGRAEALAESWVARGLAREREGTVRLTPEGWLLTDELASELDEIVE